MAGVNHATTVRLDKRKLEQLERQVPGAAKAVVDTLAANCVTHLVTHMSESPSREGEPPGIDIGNLVNSIEWEPVGALAAQVNIGTEYAYWLEYGTENMGARPFVLPAVGHIVSTIPKALLESVVDV